MTVIAVWHNFNVTGIKTNAIKNNLNKMNSNLVTVKMYYNFVNQIFQQLNRSTKIIEFILYKLNSQIKLHMIDKE